MKTEYKHIHFVEIDPKLWECCNNEKNSIVLGTVEYRKVWNRFRYVWKAEEEIEFSIDCLEDVLDFMKNLRDC